MVANPITESPDTPPNKSRGTAYTVKPSFRCVVDEVVADMALSSALMAGANE